MRFQSFPQILVSRVKTRVDDLGGVVGFFRGLISLFPVCLNVVAPKRNTLGYLSSVGEGVQEDRGALS